METALQMPFVHNEPFTVTATTLREAAHRAHEIGLEVARQVGDKAYRVIHTEQHDEADVSVGGWDIY